MEQKQQLFEVEESLEIRHFKDEAIRHPQLNAILQDIINIFEKIRSQVAEATIDQTTYKVSIRIDVPNRLIQLHEEAHQKFKGLAWVMAKINKTPTNTSKSLRMARQGFSFRESDKDFIKGTYQLQQKELFDILKSFRDRLQAIAREILKTDIKVSDAKLVP